MEFRIKACVACGNDEPITPCFRTEASNKGECPVADRAPDLPESCDIAVDIFYDLVRTAKQIETRDNKTAWYVRPDEYLSIAQVYGLEEDELRSTWTKVRLLEKVWNETRPRIKRPKKTGGSMLRRRRR